MSDHDDGVAFRVDALELVHDGDGRFGIEIARGLVGEDNLWVGDDGAGDGGALLLAAGELERKVVFFVFHVEAVERLGGFDEPAGLVVAGVDEGKGDVFDNGEVRDEVEILKDEADFLGAEASLAARGDAVDGLVV